jgi:hypothetical protein
MYNNPIRVKAANPIVTAIIDEPEKPTFNIVDVYVERQETDPPTWILILIDSNQQQYKYNLIYS